jgi:hypothetical protein
MKLIRQFVQDLREFGYRVARWNLRFTRFADAATKQGFTHVRASKARAR